MNLIKAAIASVAIPVVMLSHFAQAATSAVKLEQVVRSSGGQRYLVHIRNSMSVNQVHVEASKANVKVLKAALITSNGMEINLNQLVTSQVIQAGRVRSSEFLNRNDYTRTIDVTLESYGGLSDVWIRVTSNDGTPSLSVEKVGAKKPSPPPVVEAPKPSPPPPSVKPTPAPKPRPENPRPAPKPAPKPEQPRPNPKPEPRPEPPRPKPVPEVVYLNYPFSNQGKENVSCSYGDKGWEEHSGGHSSCQTCLQKHGTCVETCRAVDYVYYGVGEDTYGRIAKFEGRGGTSYDANRDMLNVCSYHRLKNCKEDSDRRASSNTRVISSKTCPKAAAPVKPTPPPIKPVAPNKPEAPKKPEAPGKPEPRDDQPPKKTPGRDNNDGGDKGPRDGRQNEDGSRKPGEGRSDRDRGSRDQ